MFTVLSITAVFFLVTLSTSITYELPSVVVLLVQVICGLFRFYGNGLTLQKIPLPGAEQDEGEDVGDDFVVDGDLKQGDSSMEESPSLPVIQVPVHRPHDALTPLTFIG